MLAQFRGRWLCSVEGLKTFCRENRTEHTFISDGSITTLNERIISHIWIVHRISALYFHQFIHRKLETSIDLLLMCTLEGLAIFC